MSVVYVYTTSLVFIPCSPIVSLFKAGVGVEQTPTCILQWSQTNQSSNLHKKFTEVYKFYNEQIPKNILTLFLPSSFLSLLLAVLKWVSIL